MSGGGGHGDGTLEEKGREVGKEGVESGILKVAESRRNGKIVQHCTIKKCKELRTEKNRAEIRIQGYSPVGSLNPSIPLPPALSRQGSLPKIACQAWVLP